MEELTINLDVDQNWEKIRGKLNESHLFLRFRCWLARSIGRFCRRRICSSLLRTLLLSGIFAILWFVCRRTLAFIAITRSRLWCVLWLSRCRFGLLWLLTGSGRWSRGALLLILLGWLLLRWRNRSSSPCTTSTLSRSMIGSTTATSGSATCGTAAALTVCCRLSIVILGVKKYTCLNNAQKQKQSE